MDVVGSDGIGAADDVVALVSDARECGFEEVILQVAPDGEVECLGPLGV